MARKKAVYWVIGAVVVGAAGFGAWWWLRKRKAKPAAGEEVGIPAGTVPYVPGGILPTVPGTTAPGESDLLGLLSQWLREAPTTTPGGTVPTATPTVRTEYRRPEVRVEQVKVIETYPAKTGVAPVFAPTTARELAEKGVLPGEVIRAAYPRVPAGTRLIAIPRWEPEESKLVYKPGTGWVRTTSKLTPTTPPTTTPKAGPRGVTIK